MSLKKCLSITLFFMFSLGNLLCEVEDFNPFTFEPTVTNARGAALGNTSVLSSGGSGFVFDNPAMLSSLKNKNMSLSSRLITGNSDYKEIGEDYETDKEKIEYPAHFKLNGVSLAIPYHSDNLYLGFGAGIRTYYDNSYDLKYENTFDDDTHFKYERNSRLYTNLIVLGGGINLKNTAFLGLSYSFSAFSKGSIEGKQTYDYSTGENESYKSEQDYEYKASFFTLAGVYKVSPNFTVATRLRTAFDHENTYIIEAEDDLDYKLTTKIPAELALAVEYNNLRNTKIYLEYLTRSFDKYEVNYRVEMGTEQYTGSDKPWSESKSGISLRGGIETGNQVKFRLGGYLQNIPFFKDDKRDPVSEIGATTGLGFVWGKMPLDIYAQYSKTEYDYYSEEYGTTTKYDYSRFMFGITAGINL